MRLLLARFASFATLLLAAPLLFASALSLTTPLRPDGRFAYGDLGLSGGVVLTATLTYSGPPCPGTLVFPPVQGTVSATVDGVLRATDQRFFLSFDRACQDGQWTAGADIFFPTLDMGPHEIVAHYSGEPGIDPATSAPINITVVPAYLRDLPRGLGTLGIGIAPAGQVSLTPGTPVTLTTGDSPAASVPPPDLPFPYGFLDYRMNVSHECGFLCPPLPPFPVVEQMQLRFPAPLPSNATVWVFAPNNRDPAPQWTQVPARIDGRLVTLTLHGGFIGGVPDPDPVLRGTLAVSIPAAVARDYDWRGMWWGGASENGWGVSLAQDGDHLFGVLYIYDAAGNPMWLVMGAGRWDPTNSVFNALLYRGVSASGDGEPVGTIALSSQEPGHALIEYDVGGVHGLRVIEKMASSTAGDAAIYTGAWDEVPFGGGLTIDAAGDSLFVGWPTYLSGNDPTWLIMPSGQWIGPNTFRGTLYRTHASSWIDMRYDVGSLHVSTAGSMTITFIDGNHATIAYEVDGVAGTRSIVRHRF